MSAGKVSSVTVDADRARADCSAALHVTTGGPLAVTLSDCPGGRHRSFAFG